MILVLNIARVISAQIKVASNHGIEEMAVGGPDRMR